MLAVAILAAGMTIAGAVLYSAGVFEKMFRPEWEEAVRSELLDSAGAQFSSVVTSKDGRVTCGVVTSTNKFGGRGQSSFTAIEPKFSAQRWLVLIYSGYDANAFEGCN